MAARCVVVAVIGSAVLSVCPAGAGPQTPQHESSQGLTVRVDGGRTELSIGEGVPFHNTTGEVANARWIEVPGSSIHLALWEERWADRSAVPFYGISFDGGSMAAIRSTSYRLMLRHGEYDPGSGIPPVAAALAANQTTKLYIVQFVTQPLEVFRTTITDMGGTVYNYVAHHAHIVLMEPEVRDAVAGLVFVRSVVPYHPAYRLEEFMLNNLDRAEDLFPSQRYNIQVFEPGIGQKNVVATRVVALGGTVNLPDAGKYLLQATLTPAQLFEVVHWDEVLFVDRWSPFEPDMNNAREAGGSNHIETIAGYTGSGVRGEVFDAGFNLSHVDFASRPLILHGAVGTNSHGAATSGICFGDGTGDPNARGLLPDGQGIVADYNTVPMTGPSRYAHTGELVQAPYFAVFQTASVGSARTLQYTTISADTDAALFDFDIVHCQSQSNAGNQMSRPQAWAKNIISGGGVRHYDTLTTSDDCWCGGASIGPAADGRIKPDLCAYYDYIRTTTTGSSTAYTSTFGGTSGATPIIAGHVGLFFQMWADGIFGNPVDPTGTVFDNRSHMTTAKAALINTASQYSFSGTGHDLTRMHQGWGWPDVGRLYDLRDKVLIVDETDVLANLESIAYAVEVGFGEPALRATLVYADPPGTTSASQHRINDLTLKVTSPLEAVYWGNYGLDAGNWSVAGGSANTVDTVENVYIQSPEAGSWTIEVIASEINQDGHVETPELDADFALVVSGVTLNPEVCGDGNCGPGEDQCNCSEDCGTPPPVETDCADGLDNDCDGFIDCDDFDCTNDPACLCDDDGVCEPGEDCFNCPNDCFSGSGATCGNGICETAEGEDCLSCPGDCNGMQTGKPSGRYCCGDGGQNPVGCEDPRCTRGGNTCSSDPSAPSCCGDGICEGLENSFNCEVDCGPPPLCGDGFCDPGEDPCNCPEDCGLPPASETDCTDGIDNDCDGSIDCDDSDCASDPACACMQRGETCTSNEECCSGRCHRERCK